MEKTVKKYFLCTLLLTALSSYAMESDTDTEELGGINPDNNNVNS